MTRRDGTHERLVALFLAGIVLLVPPVLVVFNRAERIFGVPLLYLYLFSAWAVLIALAALIARRIVAAGDAMAPPGASAEDGANDGVEPARDA